MRNRPLVTPHRSAILAARAQGLRAAMTPSETALWSRLAGKRLGVAFRRQVVVGRYIVDFVAPARRVIVEVDGGYHRQRASADARRDRVLEQLGYRVLRLSAELVTQDVEQAVARIRQALVAAE